MDWSTIIVALVSSLIPAGGFGGLLLVRENKRSKQLENETTASAQWRELYEKSEAKVESQARKIESLYKENGYLRDQNNSLTTQRAVLAMYKCETVNCTNRQPPFGTGITKINSENMNLTTTKNSKP